MSIKTDCIKFSVKKSPFRQQVTEYDCVPTTFINALSYLFNRREIPHDVVKEIYRSCLDTRSGTTGEAVEALVECIKNYSLKHKKFDLSLEYCSKKTKKEVNLKRISQCLSDHGVVMLRVTYSPEIWHYVLGLAIKDEWLYCYDPYPRTSKANKEGYEFISDGGRQEPNLRIKCSWLDKNPNAKKYRLGSKIERECVLLKRAL